MSVVEERIFPVQGYMKYCARVTGPSSYSSGGFSVDTKLENIDVCVVTLRNNPGNYLIEWSVSGGTITIKVNTISADTSTGEISKTEVAAGTDLSSYIFDIIAYGI